MSTALQLAFPGGDELSVNSPAWLYLKQQPSGGPWKIAEWADQPGEDATTPPRPGPERANKVSPTTWGYILRSCEDKTIPPCENCPSNPYFFPTSPENVIKNIATLYGRLDVAEYDSVLASDYVFRFQPADITAGMPDTLIRVEEMNFAEHLFVTGTTSGLPRASSVSLTLTVQDVSDDTRNGHQGWKRYIVSTHVVVGFANGDGLLVESPAWFYFKQEPAGSGRWRLAEWADEPSGASAQLARSGRARAAGAGGTRGSSWGTLKKIYK